MSSINSGRAWAYIGVTLGAVGSIAANVAHSLLPVNPEIGSVIAAAFWPVALLVAVEVLARVDWPAGRLVASIRYVGVVLVGSVAAVVSYRHLSGLLDHYGEDRLTVVLGPLAIDGLALVCLAALIATATEPVDSIESITDRSVRPAPTQDVALADGLRSSARSAVAATVASPPRSAVAVPKGATPSATPQSAKAPTVTAPTRPVAVPDLPVASMTPTEQVAWLARELARHPERQVADWMSATGWTKRTTDRRLAHARESATEGDATSHRVLEESTA